MYFDTAPLIYLIEGHPQFSAHVAQLIRQAVRKGESFHTSTLAVMEFSVKPLQLGKAEVIEAFEDVLRELQFTIHPVTLDVAQEAARLRAAYPTIKGLDALHVSTAKLAGCQNFITNDKQLRQLTGIHFTILSELK